MKYLTAFTIASALFSQFTSGRALVSHPLDNVLVRRQSPPNPEGAPPAPNTCPAPNQDLGQAASLWINRGRSLVPINVEIRASQNDLAGYVGITMDVNTGDVTLDAISLGRSNVVEINPEAHTGSTLGGVAGNTRTYNVYVNIEPQTTPNFREGGVDYNFRGAYPRFAVIIRLGAVWATINFAGLRQGVNAIRLVHPERYRCGGRPG